MNAEAPILSSIDANAAEFTKRAAADIVSAMVDPQAFDGDFTNTLDTLKGWIEGLQADGVAACDIQGLLADGLRRAL